MYICSIFFYYLLSVSIKDKSIVPLAGICWAARFMIKENISLTHGGCVHVCTVNSQEEFTLTFKMISICRPLFVSFYLAFQLCNVFNELDIIFFFLKKRKETNIKSN